jgi:hypothetical protein
MDWEFGFRAFERARRREIDRLTITERYIYTAIHGTPRREYLFNRRRYYYYNCIALVLDAGNHKS